LNQYFRSIYEINKSIIQSINLRFTTREAKNRINWRSIYNFGKGSK